MKIRTSELNGNALDWAVTKIIFGALAEDLKKPREVQNKYSSDWSCGGPLIEEHKIWPSENCPAGFIAHKRVSGVVSVSGSGPTVLIAAMRCLAASFFGDEVEVPNAFI